MGPALLSPKQPETTTVCPRSSDLFYIVRILYKMGHYFLNSRHIVASEELEIIKLYIENKVPLSCY